jgi:aflatoxin B1 aldehyde reductase
MSTECPPVTNINFGTMTLSYRGYGSRVHDTATAATMLTMYSDAGYQSLDTAHDYGGGSGEQMLGDLRAAQRFSIATRYAPQGANHAHERDKLKAAVRLSLTRLKTERVKILYLSPPATTARRSNQHCAASKTSTTRACSTSSV